MGLGCGCGCGQRGRNKKGRLGNWRSTKICFQRFIGRPEEYVADRWVLQSTVSSLLLHFILTFFFARKHFEILFVLFGWLWLVADTDLL